MTAAFGHLVSVQQTLPLVGGGVFSWGWFGIGVGLDRQGWTAVAKKDRVGKGRIRGRWDLCARSARLFRRLLHVCILFVV